MDFNNRGLAMNGTDWLALALIIVGAVNWGLVGFGILIGENWNLVDLLLGWSPIIEATVYLLVGLAGLYAIYFAYQLGAAESEVTSVRAD